MLNVSRLDSFRQDSSEPGQIRPDPVILAGSRPDQWPDPVRSGRIPAILARSGQIRPDSGQILPESSPPAFGVVAGFRPFWPDPAGSVPDPVRSGRFRPDSAGI
jgi:hypothetical protein